MLLPALNEPMTRLVVAFGSFLTLTSCVTFALPAVEDVLSVTEAVLDADSAGTGVGSGDVVGVGSGVGVAVGVGVGVGVTVTAGMTAGITVGVGVGVGVFFGVAVGTGVFTGVGVAAGTDVTDETAEDAALSVLLPPQAESISIAEREKAKTAASVFIFFIVLFSPENLKASPLVFKKEWGRKTRPTL